ncbi:MAG: response regulator [Alphaproteobacteria bacterium]|nr:response regulator [Alphaproteobacteria bacterium]
MENANEGSRSVGPMGLAAVGVVAVALVGGAVAGGVTLGQVRAAPGFVGVGVFAFACALATALAASKPGRSHPNVDGSIALGLVVTLLGAGFLFGPLSGPVAAGVPLAALLTSQKLGRSWALGVLAVGIPGALGLWGLAWLGVLPYAPAFTSPPAADLTRAGLAWSAMVLASGLAVGLVGPPPPPRPSRSVPPATTLPPAQARAGRTTLGNSSDRLTTQELTAARAALGGDDASLPPTPEIEATLELQKLESLGVLAGGIAHDFNNLLMSILGNSSLALMEAENHPQVMQPLREIEVAAKRARDLVGQLLAYAGKGAVSTTPLDLNQLVREMGDLLATAGSRRATIEYRFCEQVPLIVADPTQVRQIVMNLITNAADAMQGQSNPQIDVVTEHVRLDRRQLDATLIGIACEPGAYVMLRVTDRGCGMSEETLSRIFDPFYTTKKTGRGLGLAAVLGIVRRYGGTMGVESVVDRGTTFRIYFPYAEAMDEDEDLPTEHTSTANGWAARESGAILVVDDDPVVLRVTTRMVLRLHFEVLEAVSGEQAVEIFAEQKDRIIATVIDMTMPGMDGVETLAQIRRIAPEARVILTSGYSEADIPKTEAVFLQKPYTMKQLTKALDRVLE